MYSHKEFILNHPEVMVVNAMIVMALENAVDVAVEVSIMYLTCMVEALFSMIVNTVMDRGVVKPVLAVEQYNNNMGKPKTCKRVGVNTKVVPDTNQGIKLWKKTKT